MPIRLTEQQWADVQKGSEVPVRVCDPGENAAFVSLRAEVYERFRALFEEDPVTDLERLYQLEQFGRRAGWDDPAMDVYDGLENLLTYDQRLLIAKIGELSASLLQQIDACLKSALDLP